MQQCLTCYQVIESRLLMEMRSRGSQHRLKVLRDISSAPLPGQSLVVLDPSLMLAVDVFPCEDGHAQERSLFDEVLLTVEEDDEWKCRP
ncbi:hypothetical protein NIES4075_65190 [Tolypothrix sp. NIES-4075]|uniref:hypothetical protein n=1 Tax=Tolypothrix sp. NIES-4075 TaxID=2005459 RepID=UPI000B755340|nr:hypothetical protein [Tolypothrix sp. NIES-4075]GAX45498.1 hypothetical protein NIES4075_65190 [Tolypothrix sp. NIES-4075]